MIVVMRTIDWPYDLSQTYVNTIAATRTIVVDDDHHAFGKVNEQVDIPTARALAIAHREVADALDAAADLLDTAPLAVDDKPTAAPPVA